MEQEQSLLLSRKSDSNKYKTVPHLEVPVEVFAAAIAYYESDNNNSKPIYLNYIKNKNSSEKKHGQEKN